MKIYLPIIANDANPKHGLAVAYYHSEDVANVSWFYQWGPGNGDSKCIPMSYSGDNPNLPADYSGWLMVFNEPDNMPPFGSGITPKVAADKYNLLRLSYPNAKLEVGNVTLDGLHWLIDFKALISSPPDAWGMHAYFMQSTLDAENKLTNAHNVLGGQFWITEWADISGNVASNDTFREWLDKQSWIDRWAYFTNRATRDESWWPKNWKTQLWNMDGMITNIGTWFLNN